MEDVLTPHFSRIAPVMKARVALRRSVRSQDSAERSPANNVENITQSLALGWVEEDVKLHRGAARQLEATERELGEVLEFAGEVCQEVPRAEALLLFTRIEACRFQVREALRRIVLCALIAGLSSAFFSQADHDNLLRRGPRAARRRMEGEVFLFDPETEGTG